MLGGNGELPVEGDDLAKGHDVLCHNLEGPGEGQLAGEVDGVFLRGEEGAREDELAS